MQCYNKSNGTEFDQDDLKRIRCLANFVGGLTMKAHCFLDTMNMIVGMIQNVQNSHKEIRKIDTTPGLGDFQKCQLPVELSKKLIQEISFRSSRSGY